MPLPGLGSGLDGVRLAHISDLHCSPIVLGRYLRQCVAAINAMDVDFVAITGDFITGHKYHARRVARILRDLDPRIATLACLGNHDYGILRPSGLGNIQGLSNYVSDQLSHADIFVMLNEARVFRRNGSAIQFIGLEDYWSPAYDPRVAFEYAHRHLPTIALVHNPDAARDVAGHGADWVLSGHTHGADVKMSLILPAHHKDYHAGLYPLGSGKHLYVTRGVSYGRRNLDNPRPEITLFTLRDAKV